MTIYDFDNDFAHYETDENTQKALGMVWIVNKNLHKFTKLGLTKPQFYLYLNCKQLEKR